MGLTGKGIDYSRFDKIEDSDDEKVQDGGEPAKAQAPKIPHCYNCHKEVAKPLRCGQCKQAEYCSTQCQKDDWRFHKRNCKKPEEKKAEAKPKPSQPRQTEDKKSKKAEDVVRDDDDDEKLTWYRHREWKPTAEPKKEFKPTAIAGGAEAAAAQEEAAAPRAGSAWNAAGTWEEKDVTAMAHRTLQEQLRDFPSVDAAGGVLSVTSVDAVEGEASKPVIRGKQRHLFDLSFKVKLEFKWMDSSGQQKLVADVAVSDFTNDVFHEGAGGEPAVRLNLPKGLLEMGRWQAVEAAIGAGTWPPKAGSLMADVAAKMQAWAKDYEQAA